VKSKNFPGATPRTSKKTQKREGRGRKEQGRGREVEGSGRMGWGRKEGKGKGREGEERREGRREGRGGQGNGRNVQLTTWAEENVTQSVFLFAASCILM
jgi:hypothetical protein